MRLAARLLVFGLGLALGIAVAVPAWVASVGVRAEEAIERRLGVDLDIGKTSWSLSGQAVFEDVRVMARSAGPGEADIVRIRRVEMEVEPRWISGKIRIDSARVVGVEASILRHEDGTLNISGPLRSLVHPIQGVGSGGVGGGLSRFVDRHVPSFTVEDAQIDLDLGEGLPLDLPRRVRFGGGRLEAHNTALLKEENNLTLSASFGDVSLSPGNRISIRAVVPLGGGDLPIDVKFQRPMAFPFKDRLLLIGGLGWRAGVLQVREIALTAPKTSGGPESPASNATPATIASIQALSARIDTGALVAGLTTGGSSARSALQGAVSGVTLERPALIFEEHPGGHSLQDLITGKPLSEDSRVSLPDHALGPLMAATKRAVAAFDRRKNDRTGTGVRGLLVRGAGHLERAVRKASGLISELAGFIPLAALNVHEGTFAWRDAVIEAGGRADIAGRLENFNLVSRRQGDVITFDASFIAPGSGRESNRIKGSVQVATGDLELRADIKHMGLYPYRHVFPSSVPVAEKTTLRDTEVTLAWSPASRVARLSGKIMVDDATFYFRPLAGDVLGGMNVQLRFDAELDTVRKVIVLEKSEFRLGLARTSLRGEVTHYDTAPRLSAALRLERSRCQDVIDALPKQLIPLLDGLAVEGTIAWQVDFELDTGDMDSLKYHSNPQLNQFRVTDMGKRLNLDAVRGTFLHRIQESDGEIVELLVGPGLPNWAPLSGISPYVVKGVTTTEDGSFFRHEGFSPHHIKQSIVTNLKKGGFYRGASTITQQLVKNLFLTREKTISRKLQELFITSQVETALGKERIMELYLNVIEFGPHIYGIKQASRHYFGKHPFDLTALESVFLVSLIPSPKRYYHQFTRGEVTDSWRRHLRWIMKTMRDRKKISDYDYVSAAPYSPVFRQRNPPPDDEEEDGNQATDGADAKPQDAPGQEAADGEPDPGTKRQTGPPPGTPAGP